MTIILCAINAETGEVLNRDGSVVGKVGKLKSDLAMNNAGHEISQYTTGFADIYGAMLAASRVDLSGCEVKVRDTPGQVVSGTPETTAFLRGWKAGIKAVNDQMPKVKK